MKKILMILAAILALGSLTAKAQMRSGVDTLTLDQVKYRIIYDANGKPIKPKARKRVFNPIISKAFHFRFLRVSTKI